MAPRTPLLRPSRYFQERRVSLARAAGVVALLTVAVAAAVYVMGWVFTARIDGTVMVDNPAYPGEMFCAGDTPTEVDGCDQPPEVERDIDSLLWSAVTPLVGQVLWTVPAGWLLVGAVFHAGTWLAGGEGGPGRSFAVAGWGMATGFVTLAIGLVVLAVTFDPVTVAPGDDPAALREAVLGSLSALRLVGAVGGVVTALWSGVIWTVGLHHARQVTTGRAAVVAGVVVLLGILGGG